MRVAMLVWALSCLVPGVAVADEVDGDDATLAPYFVVPGVDARLDPLPLREVAVHADVSGVVADVTLTQLWENDGATPLNATYVFPLSTRAAVHALEMRVGGRRIVATIKEKQEARAIFDEAQRRGRTATLLEQQRPNMFTTAVANIQPGDVVEVELRYVELLRPTDGVYSLVVPRVVGPRYVSPSEAFADVPWSVMAPSDERPTPALHAWPVTVSLAGGLPVRWAQSSTHALATSVEESGWEIELADSEPDATRDFVLDYALGGDAMESGVLLQPDDEGGGHFLALIEPPERVEPDLVPARDYVFIVDTSGSMSGWPLAFAQRLVGLLVDGLGPQDKVNVVCFSGGSERLAPASLPAPREHKARAKAFLSRQRGAGGTELLPALEDALGRPSPAGARGAQAKLARTFVLVTDGYVSVEAQAIDLIRTRARDASVFAIGVGDGVNRHLIEAVAHAGRGEPYLATHEGEAAALAERFFEDVRAPLLTDIRVAFEGLEVLDVEPAVIPTLYASRLLLVSGRYRGTIAGGALVVSGQGGRGPWQARVPLAAGERHPAVPLLWARERIARLSDYAGLAAAPDHQAAITALGLEYALVTRHTSFVAVDDDEVAAVAEPVAADSEVIAANHYSLAGQGMAGMSISGGGMGGGGMGSSGAGMGMGRIQGVGTASASGVARGSGVKGKKVVTLALSLWALPARTLPAHGLRAPFQRRIGLLRACLSAATAQTLAWQFVVGSGGRIGELTLAQGSLDAEASRCVERQLARLRLPVDKGAYRLELRLD